MKKRVIFSFRATGEGHISSVVFRSGILDKHNNLSIEPVGKMLAEADKIIRNTYNKKSFREKLEEMQDHGSAVIPPIVDVDEIQVPENVISAAIIEKKDEMQEQAKTITPDFILEKLGDSFTYGELMWNLGIAIKDTAITEEHIKIINQMMWLASSHITKFTFQLIQPFPSG